MGGKNSPTMAKNCVFALNKVKLAQLGPKMERKGLKIVFQYQKYLFAISGTYAFGGKHSE